MSTAAFALRHARIVVFAAVLLAVLGAFSYVAAPESIFPSMRFSRVDVVADAGDLPPERVRIAVTRPLETALQTLPSVTRVRATSSQGSAELLLDFATGTAPQTDLQYVDQAIASLRSSLPEAKSIDAVVINPNAEPVVSYMLRSRSVSQAELRQIVQTRVLPLFAGTPGLGRLTLVGGPPIEYHVELEAAALAATGLSANDVASAIASANAVQSVGSAAIRHERYVYLIDASLRSARDIAAIGIPLKSGGTVPLGSLGTVRYTTGIAVDEAATHGEHAVNLNAYALPDADAVRLAREVIRRMQASRARLPADVSIVKYWDQTRLIVDSQTSLRDAILLGALLAVIVIYLFLRNWRMTLVAAAIIPLAMAITIFALERSGQSLNLMSVGGLAVAVGLIIDDAIVVIEAIARGIAANPDAARSEVIARSAGALALPMTASTATTVVVFLPLGLLGGVPGFFFRALAFTLATSLVVSLLLALFVTPVLARGLLARGTARVAHGEGIDRAYVPILRWALRRRAIVYAGAAAILLTTAFVLGRLPSDFLPSLDEGEFEIAYTLPPGATLRDSDTAAARMERLVAGDPDVASEGRLTGIDTNGYSPVQANTGTIRASLVTGNRASYDAIAARLRDRLSNAVPAASLDFHQLLEDQINDLSGAPAPIEIAISGPSQARLIPLANQMADAIGKIPGVVDAFNGITYDDPTLRIAPSAARLAAVGATSSDFTDALTAQLQGSPATEIAGTETSVPVRVSVAGESPSLAGGGAVFLHGGAVGIAGASTIASPGLASDVDEQNGTRLLRVTANIEGRSLSAVVADLQAVMRRHPMPPGYAMQLQGTYESQQSSFRQFLTVIAVAVLLVFTVMLAVFGSFALPLVILCAIPLALIGVALGLLVTGTPLNVSSFMGLLLLVGIVVKNGILLIDVANRRRAAGASIEESLVAAGTERLRPILMTTLAAIGGLFPLALGLGAGAEMEKPLAIAVIGGLSTATAFTLVVIPVLYATFTGGRRSARRAATVAGIAVTLFLAATAAPICAQGTAGTQGGSEQSSPSQPAGPQSGTSLPSTQPTVQQPQGSAMPSSGTNGGAPPVDTTGPAQPPSLPSTDFAIPFGTPAHPDLVVIAFGGLPLADAERAALAVSPDVRVARASFATAQAALAEARGTNGLAGTANYTEAPQGSDIGTIGARVTNVGASVTLGDLLAQGPLVAQADASLESARSDELAAERLERIRVVSLYYAALKARVAYAARTGAAGNAQQFVAIAGKRYRAGDVPRLDVVRAQVAAAQARADLITAQAADANATDALARETGRPFAVFATVVSGRPPQPSSLTPQSASARALAVRADLRSAESAVAAARFGVTAARRAAIPPVTVGAGYSTGSDSGFPIAGPTLSVQATVPFSGVASARVRRQESSVDAAIARRDGVRQDIETSVAAAARTARASIDARNATATAVSAAREAYDATRLGYASGASSGFEVSQARSTYAQAVVDDLSTLYDELQAQATLELVVSP